MDLGESLLIFPFSMLLIIYCVVDTFAGFFVLISVMLTGVECIWEFILFKF